MGVVFFKGHICGCSILQGSLFVLLFLQASDEGNGQARGQLPAYGKGPAHAGFSGSIWYSSYTRRGEGEKREGEEWEGKSELGRGGSSGSE